MTRHPDAAARLDRAIDTLLHEPPAPRPIGPPRPMGEPGADGDGELVATARLLRDALPRMHPRFGFEELLAARLAAAARPAQDGASAGRASVVTPLPTAIGRGGLRLPGGLAALAEAPSVLDAGGARAMLAGPVGADADGAVHRRRRGLVAGGAIASGVSLALPLAGAAYVVWRRSRSSGGIL